MSRPLLCRYQRIDLRIQPASVWCLGAERDVHVQFIRDRWNVLDEAYLADGMMEELVNKLGKVPNVQVRPLGKGETALSLGVAYTLVKAPRACKPKGFVLRSANAHCLDPTPVAQ